MWKYIKSLFKMQKEKLYTLEEVEELCKDAYFVGALQWRKIQRGSRTTSFDEWKEKHLKK